MKLINNLLKFFILLFFLLFLIITAFYYNNSIYKKLNDLSKENSYVNKITEYMDVAYAELNFFKYFSDLNLTESEIINLKLSGSDVKFIKEQTELFKEVGFIKDELNFWRKAKILVDGKEEEIKFKLHGTSISPIVSHNSFSLRIKHKRNEGNYLDNMREYSLITYKDDLDTSTIHLNKFASEFNLISPHGRIVELNINNVLIGPYMLVEHHGKEWFEDIHQTTNYTLIKSNDDWDRKESYTGSAHTSFLDYTVHNKEYNSSSSEAPIAIGALNVLLKSIEDEDLEAVKQLIDLEYAARYLSLLVFTNNAHQVTGDNFKYIYDHTRGEFKFLFRIEDSIKPISESIIDFNSSWFLSYFNPSTNLDLFRILIQDNNFRKLRDKFLLEIVKNESKLIADAEYVFNKSKRVLNRNNISIRREDFNHGLYIENIRNNVKAIKQYLSYGKVFITSEKLKEDIYKLSIMNDSYIPLEVNTVFINKGTLDSPENISIPLQKRFFVPSPNLTKNFLPIYKPTDIFIESFNPIEKITFKNTITNEIIDSKDTYLIPISSLKESKESIIEVLKRNEINFNLKDNLVEIFPGEYFLRENLVFPLNLNIKFNSGVNFVLEKDVSFLIQGNFFAEGTEENPITIINRNKNEPFGTFAVIGKKNKAEVILKNFFIQGGSESIISGITFLGQLSIHNANLFMDKSSVEFSFSDDGMNVRNSNVEIKDSIFRNNFADQIDLDFCEGTVSKSLFFFKKDISNVADPNGDGLDISGSKIHILENNYFGFDDKAISIGENSKALIEKNQFDANLRAIAVKDGSKAFILSSNIFQNNNYNYSVYIKKRFYEAPKLFLEKGINASKIENLVNNFDSIMALNRNNILAEYEKR